MNAREAGLSADPPHRHRTRRERHRQGPARRAGDQLEIVVARHRVDAHMVDRCDAGRYQIGSAASSPDTTRAAPPRSCTTRRRPTGNRRRPAPCRRSYGRPMRRRPISDRIRRIVTGHDASGTAKVLHDAPATNWKSSSPGTVSTLIWSTDATPADIARGETIADGGARSLGTAPPAHGTRFAVIDFPP